MQRACPLSATFYSPRELPYLGQEVCDPAGMLQVAPKQEGVRSAVPPFMLDWDAYVRACCQQVGMRVYEDGGRPQSRPRKRIHPHTHVRTCMHDCEELSQSHA